MVAVYLLQWLIYPKRYNRVLVRPLQDRKRVALEVGGGDGYVAVGKMRGSARQIRQPRQSRHATPKPERDCRGHRLRQLGRSAFYLDVSAVHDGDAVAKKLCFFQVVGGQHHGHPGVVELFE